jgi:hypothetical protein
LTGRVSESSGSLVKQIGPTSTVYLTALQWQVLRSSITSRLLGHNPVGLTLRGGRAWWVGIVERSVAVQCRSGHELNATITFHSVKTSPVPAHLHQVYSLTVPHSHSADRGKTHLPGVTPRFSDLLTVLRTAAPPIDQLNRPPLFGITFGNSFRHCLSLQTTLSTPGRIRKRPPTLCYATRRTAIRPRASSEKSARRTLGHGHGWESWDWLGQVDSSVSLPSVRRYHGFTAGYIKQPQRSLHVVFVINPLPLCLQYCCQPPRPPSSSPSSLALVVRNITVKLAKMECTWSVDELQHNYPRDFGTCRKLFAPASL